MINFNDTPNLEGYYEKGNWIPAQKEYEYEFDYGIIIQINPEGIPAFQFKNPQGKFEPVEIALIDFDLEEGSWIWIKILNCSRQELNGKEITLKNPSKEIFDGLQDGLENWEERWSISKEGSIDTNSINREFLENWTSWFCQLINTCFPTLNLSMENSLEEFINKEFGASFTGFIAFKNVILRKKEVLITTIEYSYSIELYEFDVKSFEEQFNIKFEEKKEYGFENLTLEVKKGKRFIKVIHSGNELKLVSNILKNKEGLKLLFLQNPVKEFCSIPNW